MNPEEEKSTDWWAKFLFDKLNANIIVRNIEVGKKDAMEFDAITVQWSRPENRFESDPIIGCVETKLANTRPREQADKLIKQLVMRDRKRAFNYITGMMDKTVDIDEMALPQWAGIIEASTPERGGAIPTAILKRPPHSRIVVYGRERERLLMVVRQLYRIAANVGEKTLFVKCQLKECNYFYAFGYGERPPGLEGDYTQRHSRFCPNAADKGRMYMYYTFEARVGRRVYCSRRAFGWLN